MMPQVTCHSHCPEGASSQCFYNRALANHKKPPCHKMTASDRTALEPVLARLSDRALLHCCTHGMTQNTIECLHSVIWSQSSKNTHESLLAVEKAVADAVLRFNQGMVETIKAIAGQLVSSAGSCLIRRRLEKDKRRLCKANKGHTRERKAQEEDGQETQAQCEPGLL